ncbi:MAG TPA: hypothetical protein VNZ26_19330 [Vicinamibacterales bacterium]|jgi:hypothetical protein|nr:hypothetical protein [Vicinamibacterales bacterium]
MLFIFETLAILRGSWPVLCAALGRSLEAARSQAILRVIFRG